MTAVIYDQRLRFTIMLSQNMAKLSEEEREKAFEQYPESAVADVRRTLRLIELTNRGRRKKDADSGSED